MVRQLSLLAGSGLAGDAARIDLGQGSWVDHQPLWLPNPDGLFDELAATLAWRSTSRPMYDRIVDVPRLIVSFDRDVLPVSLAAVADAIEDRYERPIRSVGCNLYRDGDDSVAWHADRVKNPLDCVIAIVSLGQPRPFLLRPPPTDESAHVPVRRFVLGDGDLLAMGGTAQATCQHAVPKVRHAGPRISVTCRT